MTDLGQLQRTEGFERNQQLIEHLESDAGSSTTSFTVGGETLSRDAILTRLQANPDGLISDTFAQAIEERRAPDALATPNIPVDGAFNLPGGFTNGSTRGVVVGGAARRTDVAAAEDSVTLDAPVHGHYPTVARDRFDSARMASLQRVVNAAGYSESTGAAALNDDGDGGSLTGTGIDWLANTAGSPTTDPQDPRFWQSVHAHATRTEGDRGEAMRTALNAAFDGARSAEAPRQGYPTVPADTYNSGKIEGLQRIINAAGYAEATGKAVLGVDGDGGDFTAEGIGWMAETAGAESADPNTPEFWQAVHTYASRLEGPKGQAMRSAVSEAIGTEVTFDAPVGDTQIPTHGTNRTAPTDEATNDVETPAVTRTEFPVVGLDARDSMRLENLQRIVNAAGYAESSGLPPLDPDGDTGPKTRAGVRWLGEQTGAPNNDPSDPQFWQALENHAGTLTGNRATQYRGALDAAKAWTGLPEPGPAGYPTVSRDAMNSDRFQALQRLINAAGYAEKTGQPALNDDGDSGDLSLAGIDWLAREVGAPNADPNTPLFWGHVDKYAQSASQEVKDALQAARSVRSGPRPGNGLPNNYPPTQPSTVGSNGVAAPGTVGYLLNGVRTMGIQPALRDHLQRMASHFNVGITVWSGGQYAKGDGPRTGSNRHDHGNAADIIIHDANGRRLSHSELFKFRSYWLDNDLGSVGYGMDEGFGPRTGLHLDLFRKEHRGPNQGASWTYDE